MEEDKRISVDNRVVLLEVGNCSQMDHPSGHIPHGQFDSDGRLEGKVSPVLFFHIDKELLGRTSDYLGGRLGQRGRKA